MDSRLYHDPSNPNISSSLKPCSLCTRGSCNCKDYPSFAIIMDYSTIANDHPEGASPWQTSPAPNRSSFERSANDSIPPSPSPEQTQTETSAAVDGDGPQASPPDTHNHDVPTHNHDVPDTSDQDTLAPPFPEDEPISISNNRESRRPNTTSKPDIRFQDQPLTEEELRQKQLQQQRQQERYQQALHAQQHARGTGPNRYHGQPGRGGQRAPPQYKLQAKITGLERTGKKDPSIRFDIHTNLPKFRTTQVRDIKRTHSEFVKLADHLVSSNPEAFVPAVPPAITSAGAGTDEDETRTKASLQRWLNYVCSNDVLMRDDEMVFFVESDAGYSPMIRMKQPATGVRRKVIKQFAPPPDDTPELQDARPIVKAFYLGAMETGQKVDRVVKCRRSKEYPSTTFV